jgi:hypothetical protein
LSAAADMCGSSSARSNAMGSVAYRGIEKALLWSIDVMKVILNHLLKGGLNADMVREVRIRAFRTTSLVHLPSAERALHRILNQRFVTMTVGA